MDIEELKKNLPRIINHGILATLAISMFEGDFIFPRFSHKKRMFTTQFPQTIKYIELI